MEKEQTKISHSTTLAFTTVFIIAGAYIMVYKITSGHYGEVSFWMAPYFLPVSLGLFICMAFCLQASEENHKRGQKEGIILLRLLTVVCAILGFIVL